MRLTRVLLGLTMYNLKCTCVLLNVWDPWRFLIHFWAGFQDICPILISLPFYTLCTMGPYIKLYLTKRIYSLKVDFFVVWFKLLLKAHWMYLALYMILFFNMDRIFTIGQNISSIVSWLLWSTRPIWNNWFCPLLQFTVFIYFCHWQNT